MESDEPLTQFSAKLSAIVNEAKNLGKTYKDHKLVKKLIRCLPAKYAAHKAVMRVAGNTDTLKFEDLVDMLKSEEMEVAEDLKVRDKGLALKADEEKADELKEIRENIALMARSFGKDLKRVERRKNRFFVDGQDLMQKNLVTHFIEVTRKSHKEDVMFGALNVEAMVTLNLNVRG